MRPARARAPSPRPGPDAGGDRVADRETPGV